MATINSGEHAKRASATKTGPGRYHQAGHKKATPKPSKGAPAYFEVHKASASKRLRRIGIKAAGRRQFLKHMKLARAEAALSQRAEAA